MLCTRDNNCPPHPALPAPSAASDRDQIDETHWNIDCMYSSVIAFDET